jgi:hypothetical protein
VVRDGDAVRYVPSRHARARVAGDQDGAWPKAIANRHRAEVRRTQGAIYRYPLDDGDGVVEAFVTDWTAMPAACAMAVHPGHRLSAGPLPPGQTAAFTGRYCRHPLTGDLLPVWVADWVKPEFGTGAVVVNPGHSQADYDFARQVGLPVRLALAPPGYDGSPDQWVTPPYIRSGTAFRSGGADGLPHDQAGAAHLRLATERGLAEAWTDASVGSFVVATRAGDEVVPTLALSALDPAVRSARLTVVSPSRLVESDLFALRLLLAEPGIDPPVEVAPEVVVVGDVAGTRDDTPDDVLSLALLVSAAPRDTAALKAQQVESCERFLKVHQALVNGASADPPDGQVSADVARAAAQVKALLVAGDPKQAFVHLYRLQKGLAKGDRVEGSDLLRYQALAHVLAGVGGPGSHDALVDAWRQA